MFAPGNVSRLMEKASNILVQSLQKTKQKKQPFFWTPFQKKHDQRKEIRMYPCWNKKNWIKIRFFVVFLLFFLFKNKANQSEENLSHTIRGRSLWLSGTRRAVKRLALKKKEKTRCRLPRWMFLCNSLRLKVLVYDRPRQLLQIFFFFFLCPISVK